MVAISDGNFGKISINLFLLAGASLLIILHLMSLYMGALAIIIAILENAVIYYFLLTQKNERALFYMCLFYTTSYSNTVFFGKSLGLDTIYCVENLPIFHGYLMLLSFFILFVNVKFSKKRKIHKIHNTLSYFSTYTVFTGLLMGIFTILMSGFQYRAIVSDLNQCVIPALMILICLDMFNNDPPYAKKYLSLLVHILISYVIIAWITTTFGIYANFVQERAKVMMLPLPSFYFSSIILFFGLMKTYKDRLIVLISFLSTVYFQLCFDSCMNGKSWIVFTTTILVGIYYFAKRIKHNLFLYGLALVILSSITIKIIPIVNSYISDTENAKLLEFISIFEAADRADLDEMDSSSQFRFLEFINVTEQYIEEPLFALTGRGYGGAIHSNGYFWDKSESGFTDDQYDSDKFYRLHESMNVIYMKFGFIGLIFLILILIKLFKGLNYNPWCYVGFIWMLFFWGYENSLLFLGLPAMVYGFLCANLQQHQSPKQIMTVQASQFKSL